MNQRHSRSKLLNPVTAQLIIRDDCRLCNYVQKELEEYAKVQLGLTLEVINLDRVEAIPNRRQLYITPAVWVNDKLWALGDLDMSRFDERVKQLLGETST